jgi:hypothetical protein
MDNAKRRPMAVTSVTINAAFLQEIKEVNEALWELLAEAREACLRVTEAKSDRRHLAGLFGRLRDQLAMHFALEEAFGYFEDPVSVAPHLSQRANDLRGQHGRLYVLIRDLAEHAEQSLYGEDHSDSPNRITALFRAFDSELKEHEACENELILEAFNEDIGVGD